MALLFRTNDSFVINCVCTFTLSPSHSFFCFNFCFSPLSTLQIFHLYLGLPHQHIPINKRGGKVEMERRGVEGSVAQRQGSGHVRYGGGEWMEREGKR